jgi:hypothetical protein
VGEAVEFAEVDGAGHGGAHFTMAAASGRPQAGRRADAVRERPIGRM